uniref:ULP_PROTEASE domain-containing protein n=1 Tax=Caenorhabditis tropicalis TaxID=1561998 RepID=A0A1I7TF05_9PELO
MSKIPVSKGGFKSWLSANDGTRSKSVLYEQKYQKHHDKIRNKENMSSDEKSPSSFVSMVNPIPTEEDFERFDADRRLRLKARDMRVAQRSASSSSRNSLSMTPELKETSPTNDQYFTPQRRTSDGLEDEFVTPTTSKKDRRRETRTPGSSKSTPVSTKPPRYVPSDYQSYYTSCLSRKIDDNFSKMENLVLSGQSLQEARNQVIAQSSREASYIDRSPRRSLRRTVGDGLGVNRSSSQPPPIASLNVLPRTSRPESPSTVNNKSIDTPILRTSYVDTLVSTHQVQIQYADQVAVGVERQMTKLESMKLLQNLAALSRSPSAEEARRKRVAAEALRKQVETKEQRDRKLEVVQDLKERIEKITNIQLSIHQLVSSQPFESDPYLTRILNSIDGWVYLPFHDFDIETAREKQALHKKMMATFLQFKNIASMHRKGSNLNKSLNTSRKSIAMKIHPSSDASTLTSSSLATNPLSKTKTREAATQVTARLAETAMTQTSPRRVGVERLDLSSLQKVNTSSQTTPKEVSIVTDATPLPIPTTPSLTKTEETSSIADIDKMLDGIQLHNESLETIDSFSHFKSDISYPAIPLSASEQSTPRSERVSLDSESARRLSAGVSHLLEQIKKEQEPFENKEVQKEKSDESSPSSATPTREDSIGEENNESVFDNQTPPSVEDSELQLYDNDTTQFEHEMEEQEEQRVLRESVVTPTPPKEEEATATDYNESISLLDPEDEQDEMRKFTNNDEFERIVEDEQQPSGVTDSNDSADDSGFLLDNKPAPPLKSIFDNVPATSSYSPGPGFRSDTPRLSPQADESVAGSMDMEEYCQKDFLNEMGPIMVKKAIEHQQSLRGLDWISAQSVWKPPSFEEINMDYYDHFDYFDSYSILIWGAVVDLINQKYLKFGRK